MNQPDLKPMTEAELRALLASNQFPSDLIFQKKYKSEITYFGNSDRITLVIRIMASGFGSSAEWGLVERFDDCVTNFLEMDATELKDVWILDKKDLKFFYRKPE